MSISVAEFSFSLYLPIYSTENFKTLSLNDNYNVEYDKIKSIILNCIEKLFLNYVKNIKHEKRYNAYTYLVYIYINRKDTKSAERVAGILIKNFIKKFR
jgi:hypothetical protein